MFSGTYNTQLKCSLQQTLNANPTRLRESPKLLLIDSVFIFRSFKCKVLQVWFFQKKKIVCLRVKIIVPSLEDIEFVG